MIKNQGTKKLETERLILRKFENNDAESFYSNVGSDEEVTKFVVWNKHKDLDVTKKAVEKWVENYKNDYVYYWAVELKETNEVIGSINCVNVDIKNKTCELGYAFGSKFWNKGYATETLNKIIEYLMNDEGYYTIYSSHLSLNSASGKVMKKCGMKYEGRLKNRMINKNTEKYDDLLSYSISNLNQK